MAVTIDGTTGIIAPAIDATLSAANLSGQVPDANAPSGSVIQAVSAINTSAVTFTANADAISGSITVAANSKIAVFASIPHYAPASGGAWNSAFAISLRQNGTQVLNCEHVGTVTDEAQCHQVPIVFTTGSLEAGTHTFVVRVGPVIAGTHYVNRDGRASTLLLMEIAA